MKQKHVFYDRLDAIFAVGSYIPLHADAEMLTVDTDTWSSVPSYPYCDNLFDAPIIDLNGAFTIFGGGCLGDDDDSALTAIVTFDPASNQWSQGKIRQNFCILFSF